MASLRSLHNYTDRCDSAAVWASRREFKLRRTWWRRVRFTPMINGLLAMGEAFRDLSLVVGGSIPQADPTGKISQSTEPQEGRDDADSRPGGEERLPA